jgi:hypothetical protein
MRVRSDRLSANRGPAGSNRWLTRRSDRDSTVNFSRHVEALRDLYERPMLPDAAQVPK